MLVRDCLCSFVVCSPTYPTLKPRTQQHRDSEREDEDEYQDILAIESNKLKRRSHYQRNKTPTAASPTTTTAAAPKAKGSKPPAQPEEEVEEAPSACLWCHAERALEDAFCWNARCPASPLFSEAALEALGFPPAPVPGGGAPLDARVFALGSAAEAGVVGGGGKGKKKGGGGSVSSAPAPAPAAASAAAVAAAAAATEGGEATATKADNPDPFAAIIPTRRLKRVRGQDASRFAEGRKRFPECAFLSHLPVQPQDAALFNTHAYVRFLDARLKKRKPQPQPAEQGQGEAAEAHGGSKRGRRGGGGGVVMAPGELWSQDPARYRWQVAEAVRKEEEARERAAAEAAARQVGFGVGMVGR